MSGVFDVPWALWFVRPAGQETRGSFRVIAQSGGWDDVSVF